MTIPETVPRPVTIPREAPEVDRCTPTRTATLTRKHDDNTPIGATAAGNTGDECCHWYKSTTLTFCGITHPPVTVFHQETPCPNGNEPCQYCIEIYNGS